MNNNEAYIPTTNNAPFTPEQVEAYGITEEQLAAFSEKPPKYDSPFLDPNASNEDKQRILGKFESQEELEKAYQELERAFHNKNNEPEPTTNEPTDETDTSAEAELTEESGEETSEPDKEPTAETKEPTEEEVADAIEKVEDETARTALADIFERAKKGEDTAKELEKIALEAGIPQDFIDTWKQKTSDVADKAADEQLTSFYEVAGGKDEFSKLTEWAGNTWSEEQIKTFNNIMDNGSEEEVKFTISNLKSMYDMSNKEEVKVEQKPIKMVKADSIAPPAGSTYKSQAEFQRDLSDPRYGQDEAYREAVLQKLKRSSIQLAITKGIGCEALSYFLTREYCLDNFI